MGYSFRLAARVLLYVPSHRQDSTYHSLCYTGTTADGSTMKDRSDDPSHYERTLLPVFSQMIEILAIKRYMLPIGKSLDANHPPTPIVIIKLMQLSTKPGFLNWCSTYVFSYIADRYWDHLSVLAPI